MEFPSRKNLLKKFGWWPKQTLLHNRSTTTVCVGATATRRRPSSQEDGAVRQRQRSGGGRHPSLSSDPSVYQRPGRPQQNVGLVHERQPDRREEPATRIGGSRIAILASRRSRPAKTPSPPIVPTTATRKSCIILPKSADVLLLFAYLAGSLSLSLVFCCWSDLGNGTICRKSRRRCSKRPSPES